MMILLSGSNDFAVRQALDELVSAALNKSGAHAIERLDGEDVDPQSLPGLLGGMSLFASERLIIVRNPGKNRALWDALGDWAGKLPAEVTVVMVEGAPDKRTRTYKQLQKHGTVREFSELQEPELVKWIVSTAMQDGAAVEARTAAYLVRQVGTDQWRLYTELQKLISANPQITAQSIDRLVEPSPQVSVFELLDAILQGDYGRAREHLLKLKTTEDPYKLFGLLVSQVQTLMVVANAQGKSPDVIAKDAGIHPYVARKMQPLARRLTAPQLRNIAASVAATDIQMKSTAVDVWMLLDQCVGKIAVR